MSIARILSSLQLPDGAPDRDLPPRATEPDHPAWAGYDRRTLLYDAIWMPEERIVRLYLPRSFNLSALVDPARLAIDGTPARLRRRSTHRRFERIDLAAGTGRPGILTVPLPDAPPAEITINEAATAPFAGRNVIYTLMRNERLDWVRDWLRFHHEVQGADAVLIADNGSDRHSLSDLRAAIGSVPGYPVAAVLDAPLPWGSRGASPGVEDGKFLQTTLLNLVRDRFLSQARAVLNVDIDELVTGRTAQGGTVFDAARRWGYATFPGDWRFTAADRDPPRHADHVMMSPGTRRCATKYVFRPQSWLGRRCLSVHSIERLNRKLFSAAGQFRFLHCRSITTAWKPGRLQTPADALRPDEEARGLLSRVFGDGPEEARP